MNPFPSLGLPALAAFSWLALVPGPAPVGAAEPPLRLRVATDDDVFVAALAKKLGYFADAGVEMVPVKVEDFSKEDYLLQAPLNRGQIDACVHWFQHTVFGARHNLPVTAVMLFNDAPGMTVMVANRMKGRIHSAADFRGRRIAQGAGYGTKSVLTGFLAAKFGVPPGSYTPVMMENAGRQEAVLAGLRQGSVDVMTFQEPITSALMKSGMVTRLYDLTTKESTARVLGAPWPAQCLLMAPGFIADHPDEVQRLVNVLVRTMRFVNSHTADEIVARLPAGYFVDEGRPAVSALIAGTLRTYARGDYAFSPAEVKLAVETLLASKFDDSEEGRWRRTAEDTSINPAQLYNNRFVERAMAEFR